MRLLILAAVTAAAAALGACRDRGQADNAINRNDALTAENIVSNDVTAIDAVTADAANMAADVDYADALANLSNNDSESKLEGSSRPKAKNPAPADSATNAE